MANSESMGSSLPTLSDFDVREEVVKIKETMDIIDSEGGRRLDNVEGDLVFLRKEFKHIIRKSETTILRILASLEVKFDKLELKVVKLENASNSGSSSRSFGKSTELVVLVCLLQASKSSGSRMKLICCFLSVTLLKAVDFVCI